MSQPRHRILYTIGTTTIWVILAFLAWLLGHAIYMAVTR